MSAPAAASTSTNPVDEATEILRKWEEEGGDRNLDDPIPMLQKLAELLEKESENYLKNDPDPFDDRHPSRSDPNCLLGQLLKVVFKKDNFMNKLVSDYMRNNYWLNDENSAEFRDNRALNVVASRLLLNLMPGLEASVVFQEQEGLLLKRLCVWARDEKEPLCSYATGLLAAAMEVQDIAAMFREKNAVLVPIMLKRIKKLQEEYFDSSEGHNFVIPERPFAILNKDSVQDESVVSEKNCTSVAVPPSKRTRYSFSSPPYVRGWASCSTQESSNSSWAILEPVLIGTFQIHPLTLAAKQILILRYLTPMGEYQELLGNFVEHDALSLILKYIDLEKNKDIRLAFEASKCLAALLCHKKFSLEFINCSGLEMLLKVVRPSVASTAVSICLYYLSCSEEAMDRVCLLPHDAKLELVKYALWLLECSHDSGRCHATMFFGLSFAYRPILELFDASDGLRRLFNGISTLQILSTSPDSVTPLNEDEEFASRQAVKHVCIALKRYFESHLMLLFEKVQKAHGRHLEDRSPQLCIMGSKIPKESCEIIQDCIQSLQELLPKKPKWTPVDNFHSLGGVTLLLQIVAMAYDWNYSGRAEIVRSALDVLSVCSVIPQVQELFCEKITLPDDVSTSGINIILGAAEGEIVHDPDVQKAALYVLINCVGMPIKLPSGNVVTSLVQASSRRKSLSKSSDELLNKIWDCVRTNNGIMVLLSLMMIKTPITNADSIRALACKALLGLSRSETVRQIVSKLTLFTSSQIQMLVREPILQEKRQEHVKFQKYAYNLMQLVSGKTKSFDNDSEVSLAHIHKADVVAQTRIQFNQKQLLHLIHNYLSSKGFDNAAVALQREANLTACPNNKNIPAARISSPLALSPKPSRPSTSGTPIRSPSTSSNPPSMGTPLRLTLANHRTPRASVSGATRNLEKAADYASYSKTPNNLSGTQDNVVSLDGIVTEYLMNQHALCKNPMATCPQFDLFTPHRCPDPKSRNAAPVNVVSRVAARSISTPNGGVDGAKLNRKLLYSRFRPQMMCRSGEDDVYFTHCCFSADGQSVIAGNSHGELKYINAMSGVEEVTYQCHESSITSLSTNSDGTLILTSSLWRRPLSALWSCGDLFDMKYSFDDKEYLEFSKLNGDKIIATKVEAASIYDVRTCTKIISLVPQTSNTYTKNRATFSPTDELVLTDGVLFDVNSGKSIHKFDKFNQTLNGVFHPNGLEILSNSAVWDIRTFHLLYMIPSLDQCVVNFSNSGDIFYGTVMDQEINRQNVSAYESSFRTFDATDYSSIATIDVKKNIYSLACNKTDLLIALVENQNSLEETVDESVVRVYEVGRRRDDDDECECDEESEEDDLADTDDGSDGTDNDNGDDESMVQDLLELLDPDQPYEPDAADEEQAQSDDSDEISVTSADSVDNNVGSHDEEEEDDDDDSSLLSDNDADDGDIIFQDLVD